jgi:hypothetical protein
MPPFTVNPHRFDPYRQFKFRVKWDGRYVAGVSRVSPLRRRTQVVAHREGGDPSMQQRSSGIASFDPSALERGRTHDAEYVAISELEANDGAMAIESLTLEYEGWQRDYHVKEPQEPSFTEPPG